MVSDVLSRVWRSFHGRLGRAQDVGSAPPVPDRGPVFEALEERILLSADPGLFANLTDYVQDHDLDTPSQTVVQYIAGQLYQWHEYEINGGEEYFVALEEPERRGLSAAEASVLLEASAGWMQPHTLPDASLLELGENPMLSELLAAPGLVGSDTAGTDQASTSQTLSQDDRVRITDTTDFPWRTIGKNYTEFNNPDGHGGGTSFLVTPYVALTNTHTIYDRDIEEAAEWVEFQPAQRLDGYDSANPQWDFAPFGSQGTSNIDYNEDYDSTRDWDIDKGALFFDEQFEGMGWTFMPVEFNFEPDDTPVHTAGYPSEAQGESTRDMWYASGEAWTRRWDSNTLRHDMTTSGGQSGSPIWREVGVQQRIIGIHAGFGLTSNRGVLFGDHNMDQILDWMAWNPIESDQYEPNGSFATAHDLGLLLQPWSSSGLTIHDPGEDDYFRFTAADSGELVVSFQSDYNHGNNRITIYRADQSILQSRTPQGDSAELTADVVAGEEYYVRVAGVGDTVNPDYALEIDAPIIAEDDYEPNHVAMAPAAVSDANLGELGHWSADGLTIHEPDNMDYFFFEAIESGPLSVTLHTEHNIEAMRLTVIPNEGTSTSVIEGDPLATGMQHPTSPIIEAETELTAGSGYFVRVHAEGGAVNPHYDLTINGPLAPDRYEPNATLAEAYDLGVLGGIWSDTNLSIHEAGNDDYFKFVAGADGEVTATFQSEHFPASNVVNILDSDGSSIAFSGTGTDETKEVTADVILGETYYVRARNMLDNTVVAYDLTIDAPRVAADHHSPNHFFGQQAVNLGPVENWSDTDLSIHMRGVGDYFHFFAPNTGQTTITLESEFNLGNNRISLYHALEEVASVTADEPTVTLTADIEAQHGYYVVIEGDDDTLNPRYDLSIENPPILPDPYEDNAGFADAYDLGTLGYWTDTGLTLHEHLNDDFFRFTPETSGEVEVTFDSQFNIGWNNIYIYSADHLELAATTQALSMPVTAHADVTAGDVYYVRVEGEGGNRNPGYALSITAPGAAPPAPELDLAGNEGNAPWFLGPVQATLAGPEDLGGIDAEYRLDENDPWRLYDEPFVIDEDGETLLEFRARDALGNVSEIDTETILIDSTRPIVSRQVTGPAGEGQWFIGPVTVELTATDDISGVDVIEYRLDGSDWNTYDDPVVLDEDGVWMFEYRVTDVAGNSSLSWGTLLPIDQTPPEASLAVSDITEPSDGHTFTVTYTDNIALRQATIMDNHEAIRVEGPNGFETLATLVATEPGSAADPLVTTYAIDAPDGEWDISHNGVYTVSLREGQITDFAGNAAEAGVIGSFNVDLGIEVVLQPTDVSAVHFTDASGTHVVVHLDGGQANLLLSGANLAIEQTDDIKTIIGGPARLEEIVLSQTTLDDTLSITADGGDGIVYLGTLFGDAPLGRFAAADVQLGGDGILMTDQGVIHHTRLGDILDGAAMVMPGDAPDQLRFEAGVVGESVTLHAAAPLQALGAVSWAGGAVHAPSIQNLTIAGNGLDDPGDFNADLTLTDAQVNNSLGNARIAGAINNATWQAAANIGRVAAGALRASNILVGADTIPGHRDDFTSEATLQSIRLTGVEGDSGPSFVDSNVAAWQIGRADLGVVDTNNNGNSFGLTTTQIRQLSYTPLGEPRPLRFNPSHWSAEPYEDEDFIVRIL